MKEKELSKLRVADAKEVCTYFELGSQAKDILDENSNTQVLLSRLFEGEHYMDAINVLAHALPKREATWWACLSARDALPEIPDELELAAIEAAEAWVYKQKEKQRRVAEKATAATDFQCPGAWAAMAAFWSGPSMAPAESPEVPPSDNLTGKAVSGAVMLSAVRDEPQLAAEKHKRFLEQGLDIAAGGKGELDSSHTREE